nr:leucine-rich repeat domain-containing protein [Prevotella sp.]
MPNEAAAIAYKAGWSDYAGKIDDAVANGNCGTGVTWDLADGGALTISGTGAMYNYDDSDNKAPWFPYRAFISSVTIDEGVTSIGEYAFYKLINSSLTTISIPSTVTSIGIGAFEESSCFTSLTIPDNVLTLGRAVFCGCDNLETVHIGSGVTTLPELAFMNSDGLTHITIPNTVTSLSEGVFQQCFNLTTVIFENGSTISTIPESAFYACKALTSIAIPESVTSIGMRAFMGCEALTSIDIPEGVTSIGIMAFTGCAFSSIVLPASITEIGAVAFAQCPNLTSVTIWNTSAPTLQKETEYFGDLGVFAMCDILSAIYVPTEDAKTAYEGADAAKNWSDYSSLLQAMGNTLTTNEADGSYWATYYNGHSNADVDANTKVYTV